MKEYILCSAIHYDDGKEHNHQPKNIKSGFVISGRRHHNCINTLGMIYPLPHNDYVVLLKRSSTQGFLTSFNRFTNREEAAQIAFDNGQIKQSTINLYSEDLY